ncbi:MAG: carbohydrate ABC transporter permease, partial [Lachnospiraceae bacterium]|nr:carbohydrate ABC transporter permease [Lachnospiraceae bacterium]
MNTTYKKRSMGDRIFYTLNTFFLVLLAVLILYPVYFIIIASVSDPDAVLGGQVFLYPVRITLEGFEKVLHRGDIWNGYANTIRYTLITVALSLLVTIPAGWALSR